MSNDQDEMMSLLKQIYDLETQMVDLDNRGACIDRRKIQSAVETNDTVCMRQLVLEMKIKLLETKRKMLIESTERNIAAMIDLVPRAVPKLKEFLHVDDNLPEHLKVQVQELTRKLAKEKSRNEKSSNGKLPDEKQSHSADLESASEEPMTNKTAAELFNSVIDKGFEFVTELAKAANENQSKIAHHVVTGYDTDNTELITELCESALKKLTSPRSHCADKETDCPNQT